MILVACSGPDAASMNIHGKLLEAGDWVEQEIPRVAGEELEYGEIGQENVGGEVGIERLHLYGNPSYENPYAPRACLAVIPGTHLYADYVERRLIDSLSSIPGRNIETDSVECLIFPSKHRAESGKKSFTIHPVGNYSGEALYGGKPGTLSPAAPGFMSDALRILKKRHANFDELSDFDVSFEVTHHGPLTAVPTFFIEIGSSENEWEIPGAGRLLATVIMELIEKYVSDGGIKHLSNGGGSATGANAAAARKEWVNIGLGGGHYAARFSDAVVEKGIDFGHMIPGYALKELDDTLAREIIVKSAGCSSDNSHLHSTLPSSRIFAHGKKNRKYYRFFEELDAKIVEL